MLPGLAPAPAPSPPKGIPKSTSAVELARREADGRLYAAPSIVPNRRPPRKRSPRRVEGEPRPGSLPAVGAQSLPVLGMYHPEELDELRALRLRNSELEATIKRAVSMPRDAPRWQSAYWQEAEKLMQHAMQYLNNGSDAHNLGRTLPDHPRQLPTSELKRACAQFVSRSMSAEEMLEAANQRIEQMSSQLGKHTPGPHRIPTTTWAEPREEQVKSDAKQKMIPLEELNAQLRKAKALHEAELERERERIVAEVTSEVSAAHARDFQQQLKEKLATAEMEMSHSLSKQRHELSGAATEQKLALERQVVELKAAAEERRKLEEEKAKEERIELFRRGFIRRLLNQEITRGWAAWLELWEAKTYAMGRLRDCGHKLRDPGFASTFIFWAQYASDRKREAEYRESLKRNQSLEGQLRFANYELGQMSLLKASQEDEMNGLRTRVTTLSSSMKEARESLAAATATKRELAELKEVYNETKDELEEAERRVSLAEAERVGHWQKAEDMLKKTLKDQRRAFDAEMQELQEQLDAKTEAQQREARIEVLRKAAMRRMLYAAVSRGWDAWIELSEARRDALATLRQLGSRIGVRGVGSAFTLWSRAYQAQKHFELYASKEQQVAMHRKEVSDLEATINQLRLDLTMVTDQRTELAQKVFELSDGAEDVTAMLAQQAEVEKARRVETFGRQVLRRMMHDGLRKGFTAWQDLWQAKTYSMNTLARTAARLRTASVKGSFEFWCADVEAKRAGIELQELRQANGELDQQVCMLKDAVERGREELTAKLATSAQDKDRALQRQLVELTGTQEEREALMAEKAKDERIEMMHRQAGRRILHADLAHAWEAWSELWEAKSYSLRRLREVASRLRTPQLVQAFALWGGLLDEKREKEQQMQLSGLQRRELELQRECDKRDKEIERLRSECDMKLMAAEEDKAIALQRQLVELTGSAEEIAAVREAEEKEARVELLRRQIGRRMLYQSVSRGFSAWLDRWQAKAYAVNRLRECGNKLREPALASAFAFWVADHGEQKRIRAWQELEAQSKSIEAQLRQARYESKQMSMLKVAQEDEIKALKEELSGVNEDMGKSIKELAVYAGLPEDNQRLRELNVRADAEAKEAIELRVEAERDVLKQLDTNKELLEKLLAEQRLKFTQAAEDVKKKLAVESKQKNAYDAELTRLKEELARKEKAHEAEASKLREELRKLTAPPPKKEKPKPKGWLDLDESPDAPPYSEQLACALRENSIRVVDLFRSWDADGDGQVSRAEFHKAMPALGLEVPKQVIDELFSEWDKDGGGEIGYSELCKILRAPRPKPAAAKGRK